MSTSSSNTPSDIEPYRITISRGDGIGPEIMEGVLRILAAAGARLEYDEIDIGEQVYLGGNTSGIEPESWDTIRRNKIWLKAPITTPRGGGYKSLNVTARKSLGLFANVRPCVSYEPFVPGAADLDVIVVRENEEDTYAGIEHRQTEEVAQCLKLISRPGCQRIVRFAFAMARHLGRKRITCLAKDNIMKMTDGLFVRIFREVAAEYPDIEAEELIVDIGTARLAANPERFDVVVTANLYGDIISDVLAEVAGSVGLCGSANFGRNISMFEAIHGSAPDIAGRDMANPSGLLHGAILMLDHIGQGACAQLIHDAWIKTLEDGVHTGEIYNEAHSTEKVGTRGFTDAVIARLGQTPVKLARPVHENKAAFVMPPEDPKPAPAVKELVGVDVFIGWSEGERETSILAERLQRLSEGLLELRLISNRGVMVWPQGFPETFRSDHWRCRFSALDKGAQVKPEEITRLLEAFTAEGLEFVKMENLYMFDGERGFSRGQGQ